MNGLPDSTLLGYIIGGIESPEVNISLTDPAFSFSMIMPLEVYYIKNSTTAVTAIQNTVLNFRAFQQAPGSDIVIEFELPRAMQVKVSAYTIGGKLIREFAAGTKIPGPHRFTFPSSDLSPGIYFVGIEAGGSIKFSKLMVR